MFLSVFGTLKLGHGYGHPTRKAKNMQNLQNAAKSDTWTHIYVGHFHPSPGNIEISTC